jgi:starch phosphorylase
MSSDEPTILEKLGMLEELARDLRWADDPRAESLWQQIDGRLWELTENPWFVLQSTPASRVRTLLDEPAFAGQLAELLELRKKELEGDTWFLRHPAASSLGCVAYFSMEYMLSEALPIYSGGLGNVAGDQLKAASDLGVPVVAVGLLYQQGYFRQVIDQEGNQQALYPFNDPGQMPVTPVRTPDGEPLRLEVALPGYSLWLRAWKAKVGRLRLYLLDTNDVANLPSYRGISSELYGGDSELRLKQEILLGIGGWRLLKALGLKPDVCHLNEGHAAFAILERARQFMEESGQPFATALAITRAGNLFTTHTAVAAGFDRFSPELLERHLGHFVQRLGIPFNEFLALGRAHAQDNTELFNMAYLAVRGSGAVNAVSRLHGKVSRRLFSSLFPRWPESEVPVGYVTNGIHVPSWSSRATFDLWGKTCEAKGWSGMAKSSALDLASVSDQEIWHLRNTNRKALVEFTRQRVSRERAIAGYPPEAVESGRRIFDPSALTLVFARRFATYKRPTLLLADPDRLIRLLTDERRPVQLILAGKAHPADEPGKGMIRQWMQFLKLPAPARQAVFLADYDMLLTNHLVQGADVWLNTPQRPWEACGTSGMKILANGGLNLSELDGWWAEQYVPEVGWALGDGQEHIGDQAWDRQEADALYRILEDQVVPEFYDRDSQGVPVGWIKRVRASMSALTAEYSADRTVREYAEKYYFPAASAFRSRSTCDDAEGIEIARWRHVLDDEWSQIHLTGFYHERDAQQHTVQVQVAAAGVPLEFFRVELFAENGDAPPLRHEMKHVAHNSHDALETYLGYLPVDRSIQDYTVRIIPNRAGVNVPLEAPLILWQR